MKPRFRFAFPPRASGAWLPAVLVAALAAMALLQLALPNAVPLPPGGAAAGGVRDVPPGAPAPVLPAAVLAARAPFAPKLPGSAGAPADAPLGGAVIAGTVGIGSSRVAMVQEPDGRIRRVPLGGMIAGWRLEALAASAARVSRAGKRIEVPYGAHAAASPPRVNSGQEDNQ